MGHSRIDDPKKYVVHKTHADEKQHKKQTTRKMKNMDSTKHNNNKKPG